MAMLENKVALVTGVTPGEAEFVRRIHAMKRTASQEEIVASALYLASYASSFTAGIALLADGGVSICKT